MENGYNGRNLINVPGYVITRCALNCILKPTLLFVPVPLVMFQVIPGTIGKTPNIIIIPNESRSSTDSNTIIT